LHNIAFRCHYQYLTTKKDKSEPSPLQKWYTLIYNSDPRCALPECLRLLPHPSSVKTNKVRKSFSIGMLDARTGCRMARCFISGRNSRLPFHFASLVVGKSKCLVQASVSFKQVSRSSKCLVQASVSFKQVSRLSKCLVDICREHQFCMARPPKNM
jgi:hypothetical protein